MLKLNKGHCVVDMSHPPSRKKLGGYREAFSLVEVVLAIGIVAFAVLAIIGTLPIGLKSVQNAETLQATSNIANQLRGQMQQLSFSGNPSGTNTIQQMASTINYYTTDGILSNNATTGPYYYRATFGVQSISASTTSVVNASFNTNNAQSIVVNLAYPPGVWNQTNTFSLLVARQTDN
jgi:uncharacterized protein (TIGR02598 family)